MELSTWFAFFAASWAISLSPGAGAIAAMSSGLSFGFGRGYFTTLGLVLGIWTQVVVVGIGLGALIAASSLAFAIVKWVGVAYLVWLGLQQWRAPAAPIVAAGCGASAHPRATNASCSAIAFMRRVQTRRESAAFDVPR